MMKKCLLATIGACGMICGVLSAIGLAADQPDATIAIVPRPLRMERKEGTFVLNGNTAILVEKGSADAENVGKQLAGWLKRSAGLELAVSPTEEANAVGNAILITGKNANTALGNEGYQLESTAKGVVITATAGPGLFYGMQTLLQLLPTEVFSPSKVEEAVVWSLPAVRIEDQPRFRWRGLMVDVSRHFFTKDEIKNYIELMSQQKLNTFHWHLNDDQGWRIEIKKYPKLTEVGAWRKDIGFRLDPKSSTAYGPDGRYGGFYTQDDVREVVAYAAARYVNVVPEIEMPGHALAALASYPELGCTGGPYSMDSPGGIFADVFCAGNDKTFEVLEGVLSEVLDLFPSKIIHIGGDEVPMDRVSWKKCEKCQARIHNEGLKGEPELQAYFIRRIEKFLAAHGRTLIGWEEILEGGLAPTADVMSWRRNGEVGVAAANAGHDVVMIPGYRCYLSRGQGPMRVNPANTNAKKKGNYDPLTLEMVYNFEPVAEGVAPDKVKHIIGSGGALWTEGTANYARLQFSTFPRACAAAEFLWLDPKLKNWEDFKNRIDTHVKRLKVQGVNYYQGQPPPAR
jgi:hexosaminidase